MIPICRPSSVSMGRRGAQSGHGCRPRHALAQPAILRPRDRLCATAHRRMGCSSRSTPVPLRLRLVCTMRSPRPVRRRSMWTARAALPVGLRAASLDLVARCTANTGGRCACSVPDPPSIRTRIACVDRSAIARSGFQSECTRVGLVAPRFKV